MSNNATTKRPGTLRGRLSVVPWLTVVPLAVVLAYADGFWLISLRGAVGAIERTQAPPLATWLQESTLSLPLFVLAVLGALTLAGRRFGPVLRKPKTVVLTALMIVAAGTLAGIAALAASSAYDYYLQLSQLDVMNAAGSAGSMGSMAAQQQATLALQVRSVVYGSGLILVTNLILVSWIVALRGGRLGAPRWPGRSKATALTTEQISARFAKA